MKCDYCDAEVADSADNTIPQGWLACRIRKPGLKGFDNPSESAIYVQGPTVCPEHKRQLQLIFQK